MQPMIEKLEIERLIGQCAAQTLVEGEVSPPAQNPDMASVLAVSGHVTLGSVEALQDKLMLDGSIGLKVLYICTQGEIYAFESASTFKHSMEMKGTMPGMVLRAYGELSKLDFKLLDGRHMQVNAEVQVECLVRSTEDVDLLRGLDGVLDLQVLPMEMHVQKTQFLSDICALRESVELSALPPARDVYMYDGAIELKSALLEAGRLAVEGELHLNVFYNSTDAEKNFTQAEFTLPFAQMMQADSLMGEIPRVTIGLQELVVSVEQESLGNSLHVEALLNIETEIYAQQRVEGITDAYSPSVPLTADKITLNTLTTLPAQKGRISVRENVMLGEDIQALRVLHVCAHACVLAKTANEGAVHMAGVVFGQIVYEQREGGIHAKSFEIPFETDLDMPDADTDSVLNVQVFVDNALGTALRDEVELRCSLRFEVQAHTQSHFEVVGALTKQDEESALQDGVIVYFAAGGDTLWQIAKKYHTTVESIAAWNPTLSSDRLNEGDKVILLIRSA